MTIFFILTLSIGIVHLASFTPTLSSSMNYDTLHNAEIVDVVEENNDDEREEEMKLIDDVNVNLRDSILSPYLYILVFSAFAHTGT